MFRRRGGPGVLSTVARTAVIAGTATAVSNKVAAGAQQKAAAQHQAQAAAAAEQEKAAAAAAVQQDLAQVQEQLAALQAQQVDTAAHPGSGSEAGSGDLIARLQQLAQLREAGMLTDEEFSAAKAKLLAG